ncbi:hypothetical protein SLE2022_138620 [Rubroshorea leprosula]
MTLRVPKDDEAESMDSFLFVCAKCLTTFPSSESLGKHEKEHGVSSKSLSKNEKEQGLSSEVFRKHEKTVSKHEKEHGLSPKALSKHEKEHGLPNPVPPMEQEESDDELLSVVAPRNLIIIHDWFV